MMWKCCFFLATLILTEISSIDVHVTPHEIDQLLSLEEALLKSDSGPLAAEAASDLDNFLLKDTKVLENPLNILFLYASHWKKFSSLWPRLKAPKDEINNFLQNLPSEKDVKGIVHHVLRIREVYNLTIQDILGGKMMGLEALRPLTIKECYLMVDVAFQETMIEEFQRWHEACQSMAPMTLEDTKLQKSYEESFEKRKKLMAGLDQFKKKHQEGAKTEQLSVMLDQQENSEEIKKQIFANYKRLCHPKTMSPSDDGYCYVDLSHFSRIEILGSDPLVAIFHGLISSKIAKNLRSVALKDLDVPRTVSAKTLDVKSASSTRSGKVAFLEDQLKVVKQLKYLTAQVTGLQTEPTEASEPIQVVHYGVGGHYEPHFDFFGSSALSEDDRVATMLFYLSEDFLGGSTVFPLLDIKFTPESGSALFWFNTERNASKGHVMSLHASCPLIGGGQKWIANLWIRERAQVFHRPCPLIDDLPT